MEEKGPPDVSAQGFTSEEIQEDLASKQKKKPAPINRKKEQDWRHLNLVFNQGDMALFIKALDALGATGLKRKLMIDHFKKTHGL